MDEIDTKLIELIQIDCRSSYGELGASVGLSVSAVNERLKKLQAQGIIRGWRGVIDPKAIGLEVLAFIYVQLDRPNHEKDFKQFVQNVNEVEECHHVTGEWSYLMKVRTKTIAELENLISEKIKGAKGIVRTHTVIALSSPKEWAPLKSGD